MLRFGTITYELMASFWPTPHTHAMFPVVAEQMNGLPKVVFSRTLNVASWSNTKLVRGDLAAEVRKMKNEKGDGMAIMGSGSIVSQLAPMQVTFSNGNVLLGYEPTSSSSSA